MTTAVRYACVAAVALAMAVTLLGGSAIAQQDTGAQKGQPKAAIAKKAAKRKGAEAKECTFEPVAAANDGYTVDVYSPNCMFHGTTLFADVDERNFSRIVEVDFTGRVVWSVKPSSYFSLPKEAIAMDVERLASGNTLFNLKHYGAFEVTRDRKIVWQHKDNGISHDVDRLANGNTIFVRGWASKGQDQVREVDASGKLVWSWNGLGQYDKPPFAAIDDEGWMHVNSVTRLDNGNTLISIRNFDRIVEVDGTGAVIHETIFDKRPTTNSKGRKKGGDSGAVIRQHDFEVLPNGLFLVPLTAANRVLEMTRGGERARMIVQSQISEEGYHGFRDANRLPNGNTLIVGFYRIFEVTPAGETVWSLRRSSETGAGSQRPSRPDSALFKAQRVAPDGTAYGG